MAATISDKFKTDLLQNIFNQYQNIGVTVGDSDRFYMGIGRTEEWDSDAVPPVPNPSRDEQLKFQETLQSIKLISDATFVVPRYNWTAGNVYEAWDNNYNSNTTISAVGDIQNSYYVITDDNNVFVCIQQGKSDNGVVRNSLYKPTDVSGNVFAAGDDGYLWRYIFTIGAAEARKFLTSAYMPVEKILDSSQGGPATGALTSARLAQVAIQQSAKPGEIIGLAVDSGGTGYTSAPTITITGVPIAGTTSLATTATATARIDTNGVLFAAEMTSFGEGYKVANVAVTGGGGSGAVLRALVSGDSGMGGNPIVNLNSSAMMFHATLTGTENTDFNVANDFRQIGIIKNPLKDSADFGSFTGDSAVNTQTAQVYKSLQLSSVTGVANIDGDQTVVQTSSGATAVVDYFDTINSIAYVHQSRATGFTAFDSTNGVTFFEGAGNVATASMVANPSGPNLRPAEAKNFSGEVIYIDNRSPITRDNEQTEDIKIVIDL
jgi:hypothetical protein